METTIRPGETVLPGPLAGLISQAISAATGGALLAGVGPSAKVPGRTAMNFSDVHVISLPNLYGGPCSACAPSGAPAVHYVSELDAPNWRVVPPTVGPLAPVLQVGVWGPLYPRVGHVIHDSPVTASGLQVFRGLNIAFQPVGINPPPDKHVVLTPSPEMSTCMQLAMPRVTPCFPAGTPPPFFELASSSVKGSYLWIIWRKRTCCVNPAQAHCGISVLGLSQPPQNVCPLP